MIPYLPKPYTLNPELLNLYHSSPEPETPRHGQIFLEAGPFFQGHHVLERRSHSHEDDACLGFRGLGFRAKGLGFRGFRV